MAESEEATNPTPEEPKLDESKPTPAPAASQEDEKAPAPESQEAEKTPAPKAQESEKAPAAKADAAPKASGAKKQPKQKRKHPAPVGGLAGNLSFSADAVERQRVVKPKGSRKVNS